MVHHYQLAEHGSITKSVAKIQLMMPMPVFHGLLLIMKDNAKSLY